MIKPIQMGLIILFVAGASFAILSHFLLTNMCSTNVIGDLCNKSWSTLQGVSVAASYLLFPVPFTWPFHVGVFKAWAKFAVIGIPLVAVLVPTIGYYWGGGSLPGQGLYAGLSIIALYALYLLVSFAIIGIAAWRSRKALRQIQ